MENLSSQILKYMKLIEKDYNLWISLHYSKKYQFLRTCPLFCEISNEYNNHKNPYCTEIKKQGKIEKCFAHQQNILNRSYNEMSFFCRCHASVEEYIKPLFIENNIALYICVSGYGTASDSLSPTPPSRELLDTLIFPLSLMLKKLIKNSNNTPYTEENKRYNEILLYLNEKHIDVSIAEISQSLNISKSYISHLFKKYNGNTLKSYCNSLCITDAKRLLSTTSLSVSEIAYSLGFDNVSYFISVFRKHTGMTPNAYRKAE